MSARTLAACCSYMGFCMHHFVHKRFHAQPMSVSMPCMSSLPAANRRCPPTVARDTCTLALSPKLRYVCGTRKLGKVRHEAAPDTAAVQPWHT